MAQKDAFSYLVAVHEAGLRGEHRLHPARLDQPERLLPARLHVCVIDNQSHMIQINDAPPSFCFECVAYVTSVPSLSWQMSSFFKSETLELRGKETATAAFLTPYLEYSCVVAALADKLIVELKRQETVLVIVRHDVRIAAARVKPAPDTCTTTIRLPPNSENETVDIAVRERNPNKTNETHHWLHSLHMIAGSCGLCWPQ
jgi:hypothetical protein